MKNKFLSGFLVLILIMLLPLSARAEPHLITVGSYDDYPLIFKDTDGVIKGLYVDLLTEIGSKENIRFVYLHGSWQDGLNRIQSGEVDLLTDMGYTTERSLYMDYGKNTLLTFWGDLYVLKTSEIKGLFDIKGKTIGILKGDIFADNFLELTKKFGINCQFIEFTSYEDVFKALADKKVEASVAAGAFKTKEEKQYGVKSTGFVFSPIAVYFTTGKNKNTDLLLLLDTYLYEWKRQGNSVFSQVTQKWLQGTITTVSVIPKWVVHVLSFFVFISLAAFAFILILKAQVKKATDKIGQREKALKNSEKYLREMVETLPVAIHLTTGPEQKTEYLNSTMVKLFGYTIDDLPFVTQWWPLAYPDESYRLQISKEWTKRVIKAIDTQSSIEPMEVIVTCKDGSKKTIAWGYITLGEKNYSFGIDLTERKQAEEKINELLAGKERLLKEVHNRIKNNMTTIRSLLTLQIEVEKNSSAVTSLKDAESRVKTIIILYDKLYSTENYHELSVKEYLEPLSAEIVSSFPNRGIVTLKTEIEDFALNVQLLTPIGIIVNELLNNVMKHAFTGREKGLVFVTLFTKKIHFTLIIEDNGIGLSSSLNLENSSGFGMQLVGMLVAQIGGTIRIERENGTRFILEVDT